MFAKAGNTRQTGGINGFKNSSFACTQNGISDEKSTSSKRRRLKAAS
jgi:hypothetical protein